MCLVISNVACPPLATESPRNVSHGGGSVPHVLYVRQRSVPCPARSKVRTRVCAPQSPANHAAGEGSVVRAPRVVVAAGTGCSDGALEQFGSCEKDCPRVHGVRIDRAGALCEPQPATAKTSTAITGSRGPTMVDYTTTPVRQLWCARFSQPYLQAKQRTEVVTWNAPSIAIVALSRRSSSWSTASSSPSESATNVDILRA